MGGDRDGDRQELGASGHSEAPLVGCEPGPGSARGTWKGAAPSLARGTRLQLECWHCRVWAAWGRGVMGGVLLASPGYHGPLGRGAASLQDTSQPSSALGGTAVAGGAEPCPWDTGHCRGTVLSPLWGVTGPLLRGVTRC